MATNGIRIGVTRELRRGEGVCAYPLTVLDDAGYPWSFLADNTNPVRADNLDSYDAIVVGGASVDAAALACAQPPLVVARLGAGYDTVDVAACTERGILVTTAPSGVRRPMAAGGIAFLLALAHRLVEKDRRTREGIFDRNCVGTGLTGLTLGVLGVGNIGRDVCGLAAPFDMRIVAHDKYAQPLAGVELVELETLLRESDFVIVTLPLTDDTHHLLNAERLALMKPSAYVINIARGPIVDQAALAAALAAGGLAGAALDVFEEEPLPLDDPLLQLPNVIVAGHDIGLTQEMIRETSRSACESIIEVAHGRVPATVINPEALAHPRLQGLVAR